MVRDIEAIRGADGPERVRLETQFLAHYDRLFYGIAQSFAGRPNVNWEFDGPDLQAIVAELAWKLLEAVGTEREVAAESWPDILGAMARSAIREYVESGASTGFSQGTGAQRRHRSLRTAADRFLREYGRQATQTELVAYHNKWITTHRVNPAKQGALVCNEGSHRAEDHHHRPRRPFHSRRRVRRRPLPAHRQGACRVTAGNIPTVRGCV